MKISFIGVGAMGGGMAMNLVRAGYTLRAITGSRAAALEPFQAAGAETSMNPLDAADSEVIFLCLPSVKAVRSVLFGEVGLAARLHPGQTLVDCSTIGYLDAREMGEALEKQGVRYLDAPVSGHETRAKDGTLTIMVGGTAEVFEAVRPLLEHMGTTILHMGGYGAGQMTKMINNCILNICTASFCELMPLGVKLGLDAEKLGKVLTTASGSSYASQMLIPQILKGDFSYGFSMEKAYKDMESMWQVTGKYAVPLPTFYGTMQTYQMALQQGHGGDYKAGMIRFYEDLLGVQCRSAGKPEDAPADEADK